MGFDSLDRNEMSVRAGPRHVKAPAAAPPSVSDCVSMNTEAFDSRQKQAADALGVDASALKPIGWLNAAHFEQLNKRNALGPDFARQIEAYRKEQECSVTCP